MINETYKRAMKAGFIINHLEDGIIPDDWSDSIELRYVVDIIKNDVNEETVINAINKVKRDSEGIVDLGWNDTVRGLIAGYYFGNPTEDTLKYAEKAEDIWNKDTKGEYGYYQEACEDVFKEIPMIEYKICTTLRIEVKGNVSKENAAKLLMKKLDDAGIDWFMHD